MCWKLIYLVSFVLVLSLLGNASADLVGYWRFDEGSGNVAYDSSGSGNDGTLNGDPQWVTGHLGGALDFDGNGDFVEIPHSQSLSITKEITIAAWTYMRANASGEMAIVSKGGWAANDLPYELTETPGGVIFWQFYDDGGRDTCAPDSPPVDEWHHIAATYDGNIFKCYIDGELADEWEYVGTMPENTASVNIGQRSRGGCLFNGIIDEVVIYDRALSEDEIPLIMMGVGGFGPASGPDPADGAIHPDTWVTLSWRPGDFAVSHDVYLGDNFDDVNEGTGDTFRANQPDTFFVAGFPGFPYPDGLVPGTTYYWRIDEVNDANVASPWKGPVWSFTVPPKTAYNPNPADGAKFVDPDADLSWTAGFGAKLHTVYFGDNFDDVNSAIGGLAQGTTTYTLDPLELEKDYYWRVDEFDAITTHKGDVWTFTTARAGGGIKGEYFNNMDLSGIPALSRVDPQINFNWASSEADPLVGADQFSVRWTGEVEAVFTETYTFYTNSDDGVRLWVDGRQLVDNWTDHGATENAGTIDLVAGQVYSLQMEFYENGGDAVAELRWSSPRTPKQLIPQAALSPPVKALSPNPPNGATGARMTTILSWSPGDDAASHQVYFGIDADAVRNATTASPQYKGSKALGSESYDPGKLAWFTTYYWRVDEVNNVHPDSPWVGNLWSFTTGDFLVVDDFELYNDINPGEEGSNRIFLTWIDGYDIPTNGSQVGYTDPPFCEQTIVHSGRQSMPLFYNNSGPAYYSEATLPLSETRDWTEEGVKILTLWFYGDPANAAESMYVAVANATGPTAVVYNDNPDAALIDDWTQWNIDLEEISNQGVVLTNVDSIAIGFGNRNNPQVGGSGMVFIDDIRLYRPASEPVEVEPIVN